MSHFKAEIELENSFSNEFTQLIPLQRKKVDELMNNGSIVSYALSIDRSKLWVVFEAKTIAHVFKLIKSFPLYAYMKADVHELAFYDSIHAGFPFPSLN